MNSILFDEWQDSYDWHVHAYITIIIVVVAAAAAAAVVVGDVDVFVVLVFCPLQDLTPGQWRAAVE